MLAIMVFHSVVGMLARVSVAGCEGFFDSGGLKISWNWFDAAVKLKIVDFLRLSDCDEWWFCGRLLWRMGGLLVAAVEFMGRCIVAKAALLGDHSGVSGLLKTLSGVERIVQRKR
ncbi:hypothetical protein SADUNF_Sadunf07G0066400 [Salix dunnii]|uniref:Uncharacterized protein n=1 Tax=Salix dunnii TaxID=1413687 RepID=A0A835K581_9ROSI|nr:hypothetical protein SADUNF_Sadunf07G0066400 [Salix dunnii]